MRFPRPQRFLVVSVCSLSRQLGVGEATANDLRHGENEAVGIGERIVLRRAVIESKCLFICVAFKVEWLNRNVGAVQAALQQAPEVLPCVWIEPRTYSFMWLTVA